MKTKKLTAVFTLTAVILSMCQPIFADMREEKLDQREKMLTERALLVSEQSVNLDDREQELNRRAAKLDELSKSIQSRNVDFSVREIELDDMKEALNRDTMLLAAQSRELARDKEQFASYKTEVERRAENASRIAKEAEDRLRTAEEREARTAKREREISEREEEIQASLSQIELEKAELLMLKEKDNDAAVKMAVLEKQKADLEAAQRIFATEKQKLEDALAKDKSQLAAITAERDKALSEAKSLRAKAEEQSYRIEEVLNKNSLQEVMITKLSADLAELSAGLAAKTNEIREMYSGTTPMNKGGLFASLLSDVPGNVSVQATQNGVINWSDGSIRAFGKGVAPDNINKAQGQLLARRAAILDLQRNILETVQGVQIDSRTKMSEYIIKYDIVESRVKGMIAGVEVLKETWNADSGIYEIAGQLRRDKLASSMSEVAKHVARKTLAREPKKKTGGNYTGLILDVRHLPVEQQKFFHIVDEKGTLVYGTECVDNDKQAREGLCVYYENVVLANDEKARVGDNPLVVRAQRFSSNGEDIVIPTSEAEKIRTNKFDFRKGCKVIVVRS